MGPARALEILREHAGSQWSLEAVGLVVATIESGEVAGTALDHVGRAVADMEFACGCTDALPGPVRDLALTGGPPS